MTVKKVYVRFSGFYKKLIKIKLNSTAIILNSYSFLKYEHVISFCGVNKI